jgi:hypothetical protein
MHLGSSSLGGIPVSGSCPGVLCGQNWYTETNDKQCEQSRVVPKDDAQAINGKGLVTKSMIP